MTRSHICQGTTIASIDLNRDNLVTHQLHQLRGQKRLKDVEKQNIQTLTGGVQLSHLDY